MKKTRTNRYLTISNKKDLLNFVTGNYKIMILLLLLVAGIVYSSFSYQSLAESKSVLVNVLTSQQNLKATQGFMDCFYNILTQYSIYFFIALIFGMCAIGAPIVAFLPFVYGMGIGFQVTFLYTQYQLKGIGYTALMIMPMAVVFSVLILYCAKESINMSWDILSLIQESKKPTIKMATYFKRQLIFALCFVVFSLLNAALITAFSPIIVLT